MDNYATSDYQHKAVSVEEQGGSSRTSTRGYRTALVLPTLNAGSGFTEWLEAFRSQTHVPDRLILVDSSSTDGTVAMAGQEGFEIHTIKREDFSHGETRQRCVDMLSKSDIIFFLTQDAVLASRDAIEKLLIRFDDHKVGAVYGRQLPRPDAGPIEAHARLFNYPERTDVRTAADIPRLGIKTAFLSNSFAAYRRTALVAVGGFPSHTIQNEDTYAASKMILAGWKVIYSADATVYHSHDFSHTDEFRRYFDIGVFHARDSWIRERFGHAEGEGLRYVRSEFDYLRRNRPSAIPSAFLRTGLKLLGYKLGGHEQWLPVWVKRRLSVNKRYWDKGKLKGGLKE